MFIAWTGARWLDNLFCFAKNLAMQWHSQVFWSLWPVIAMAAYSNYKLYKKWCLLNILLLNNLKCVECIKLNLSLKIVILKPNLLPIRLCCLGQPQHSLPPSLHLPQLCPCCHDMSGHILHYLELECVPTHLTHWDPLEMKFFI